MEANIWLATIYSLNGKSLIGELSFERQNKTICFKNGKSPISELSFEKQNESNML